MAKKKVDSEDSSGFDRLELHLQSITTGMDKLSTSQETLLVQQTKLSTQTEGVVERITRVEERFDDGHPCNQEDRLKRVELDVDKIESSVERDVHSGIKNGGRINTAEAAISDINNRIDKSNARTRNSWILAITTVIGFVSLVLGVVYSYGELTTNVSRDRAENTKQHAGFATSVNKTNKNVSDSNEEVAEQLKQFRTELSNANGHEERYESICEGMTSREKRQQRILFSGTNKRIPRSCR